jgi:hypothetical protein
MLSEESFRKAEAFIVEASLSQYHSAAYNHRHKLFREGSMAKARTALILMGMLLVQTSAALCQNTSQETFENKLYSIAEIKHFGLDPQQFVALSDTDKNNILAARDALIGLLRAIETNSSITPFVAPELIKKYKDSATLAASLIDPETSIHAVGITDFTLGKQGEIHLHFFAVVFSDGSMAVSEKSATIQRSNTGWRVATIE